MTVRIKQRIGTDVCLRLDPATAVWSVVVGSHGLGVVTSTYDSGRGGHHVTLTSVVELPKSTGSAFGVLERVFWNTTRELCVAADDAGNQAGEILVPCGLCTEAAATDDTTCEVLLNAGGAPSVEVT